MHAIIRQGNGKFYVSAVFGYYKDITAEDDYKRYIEEIYKPYWIVWDEEQKRLIRWSTMVPDKKYIIPQILIIDSDQNNWVMDEQGVGCVDFLSRELLDSFLDEEQQPTDVLEKCRTAYQSFVYNETPEIKTKKDIEDFYLASGYLHDAYIIKEEIQEDDTLHLIFDGVWGCQIEVWFWGDLDYDTSSRNPKYDDPCWYGSTVILQDGFVYLVDDDNMTAEQIVVPKRYELCEFGMNNGTAINITYESIIEANPIQHVVPCSVPPITKNKDTKATGNNIPEIILYILLFIISHLHF